MKNISNAGKKVSAVWVFITLAMGMPGVSYGDPLSDTLRSESIRNETRSTTRKATSFSNQGEEVQQRIEMPGETIYSGRDPDQKIGTYQQPRWTGERLFPGTRAYVIPEQSLQTEVWTTAKTDRSSGMSKWLFQQEVEYGFLPHFQFDFYINEVIPAGASNLSFEGVQLELRWAFADWGKIFLNPTLYLEYHPINNSPTQVEARLLLAEGLAPNWHFAANLAAEAEVDGAQTHEYALTTGVSRSFVGTLLSLGAEAKTEWSDTLPTRGSFVQEYYLGPSVQWKPDPRIRFDLVSFIGLTSASHLLETTLIFALNI